MLFNNHPDYPARPHIDGRWSESKKEEVLEEYRKRCKAFTDRQRKIVLKESEGVADTNIIYTGVGDPRLWTLKEVAIDCLKMKDSFPTTKYSFKSQAA